MTIHAWRIVKTKHFATALTGDGAKKKGGRWNSRGVAMVYTAESKSLAILEMLVHFDSSELLKRYVIFELTFEDALVTKIDPATLPKSWWKSPPPAAGQQLGDSWIDSAGSAILRVPSSIVTTEWNYLINPAHRDFARITIDPGQALRFDPRLIKPPVS